MRSRVLRPKPLPAARPMNQGRLALREAFVEAIQRLRLSPARGSEARAGRRSS